MPTPASTEGGSEILGGRFNFRKCVREHGGGYRRPCKEFDHEPVRADRKLFGGDRSIHGVSE